MTENWLSTSTLQQTCLVCNPTVQFGGILTNKITEDHLTRPTGALHTFSSNLVITFSEQYYCVYTIQKRDVIKKEEIAARHNP